MKLFSTNGKRALPNPKVQKVHCFAKRHSKVMLAVIFIAALTLTTAGFATQNINSRFSSDDQPVKETAQVAIENPPANVSEVNVSEVNIPEISAPVIRKVPNTAPDIHVAVIDDPMAITLEYHTTVRSAKTEAFLLHQRLYNGILTDVYNEATEEDAVRLAKITWCESRGIEDVVELACDMWGTLNRVDSPEFPNSVQGIIDSGHVAYRANAPTFSDYGVDLVALARDVLYRWQLEKQGVEDVGRVLPADYFYWEGKDGHNWFRQFYRNYSHLWDYSLPNPYA